MINKKSILVVEDTKDILLSLEAILSEHYIVLPASDGAKALIILEEKVPDLILLDIMLPYPLDGFSILRILKRTPEYASIPVIILSALSDEEKIFQGLEEGANDYLTKPFKLKEILLKIKNLVEIVNSANIKGMHKKLFLTDESKNITKRNNAFLISFEFIVEQYDDIDKLTIPCIAKKLSISVSKLERIIKLKYKMTPKQYICDMKLMKAEILLRSQNTGSIKTICYSSGFNSLAYFCLRFKHKYGVSPKQYQVATSN